MTTAKGTHMKTITLGLAAALLMSSGTVVAQTATDAQCLIVSNAFANSSTDDNDAQCLIVSNAFANSSTDDNQKKAAEASVYFYLGRVSDRMTAPQLKTLLDTQAKTITDKTAADTMNACVHAIQAKVQLLQSLAPKAPAAKPQQQPQGR
jgi:hypothetical protein